MLYWCANCCHKTQVVAWNKTTFKKKLCASFKLMLCKGSVEGNTWPAPWHHRTHIYVWTSAALWAILSQDSFFFFFSFLIQGHTKAAKVDTHTDNAVQDQNVVSVSLTSWMFGHEEPFSSGPLGRGQVRWLLTSREYFSTLFQLLSIFKNLWPPQKNFLSIPRVCSSETERVIMMAVKGIFCFSQVITHLSEQTTGKGRGRGREGGREGGRSWLERLGRIYLFTQRRHYAVAASRRSHREWVNLRLMACAAATARNHRASHAIVFSVDVMQKAFNVLPQMSRPLRSHQTDHFAVSW